MVGWDQRRSVLSSEPAGPPPGKCTNIGEIPQFCLHGSILPEIRAMLVPSYPNWSLLRQRRIRVTQCDEEAAMPIATNVCLGEGVRIVHPELVNLYGCTVGEQTTIGPFVEVQSDARIGARCKVSSHSFICAGVTIEDGVFVGHGVMFIN